MNFQNLRSSKYFDIFLAVFVALLLVSNISATKLIGLNLGAWFPGFELVFDGGAVLFPLTYILGDVLSEVYGMKGARRAIVLGFVISVVASLTFWVVSVAPAGPGDLNNEAFSQILGFVPRIVIASLVGYLVGQFLNAFVLVRIKARMGEKRLWVRVVASTLVGEAADTTIFCTIAFVSLISTPELINYIITGYLYKCAVEIVFLPVTYRVIALVKKRETEYAAVA